MVIYHFNILNDAKLKNYMFCNYALNLDRTDELIHYYVHAYS